MYNCIVWFCWVVLARWDGDLELEVPDSHVLDATPEVQGVGEVGSDVGVEGTVGRLGYVCESSKDGGLPGARKGAVKRTVVENATEPALDPLEKYIRRGGIVDDTSVVFRGVPTR